MTQALRMGVVGCGAIAQIMHLPFMIDDDHFEVMALADANKAILDAVGDRYGIDRRYVDWRDLMADPEIDAVALLHSGSHHDTVIAALNAGKHVFVEKPLAWNVREAEEVAACAAASDRTVQLGYHKLYDPGFVYARDEVKKMRDLAFVRITVLHPWNDLGLEHHRIRRGNGVINEGHQPVPPYGPFVKSILDSVAGDEIGGLVDEVLGPRKNEARLRLGYGLIVQSMIHQVYTLYGFLGEPSKVISTEIWREGMCLHSLIEYPNDVRVTLDYDYLPNLKDYHEEYAFYGNDERVRLQFPSPYLRNFPSPVIVQGGEGELSWEKRVIVSHDEAFRRELIAFYDNVKQHTTPISAVSDAVKHMRFLQQLIDAAR